jgi:glutamyl-tRNA reductase
MIKVVLLGGGNVAYHLTRKLINTEGIRLIQVYNRTYEKIQYLQSKT